MRDYYNSKWVMWFAPKGKLTWAVTLPWGAYYSTPESLVSDNCRRNIGQRIQIIRPPSRGRDTVVLSPGKEKRKNFLSL